MGSAPSLLRKEGFSKHSVCVSQGTGADEEKPPEKDLTLAI